MMEVLPHGSSNLGLPMRDDAPAPRITTPSAGRVLRRDDLVDLIMGLFLGLQTDLETLIWSLRMSDGVTVAQGPLEAFVLVRIQVGQPILLGESATTEPSRTDSAQNSPESEG